jgi:hypothetical protein
MARAVTAWSVGLVLFSVGAALAQEPPPLEAPAIEPDAPRAVAPKPVTSTTPAAKPATPANSPPVAASSSRPVLVVPGVTTPVPRSGNSSKPSRVPAARGGSMTGAAPFDLAPPPDATKGRSSPFRPPGGLATPRTPDASIRAPIPLTIEPLDDEPSASERPKRPAAGRVSPETPPGSARAGNRDDRSAPAKPGPWRMPGLLGRILGPPPPAPAREPARNAEAKGRAKDELPTEQLTDSELKRRIEGQIRESLGDRVRSVEVRVHGKNVLIAAQATRFWQKRAVRRSLETLPALAGYRARIDLDD